MHGGEETSKRKCFLFLLVVRLGVKLGHMQNELERFRERETWKRKPVFIKCMEWVKT